MNTGKLTIDNLTDKQINDLIDVLCVERSKNNDAKIIDEINNNRKNNPFIDEAMDIESDRINIENDIINSMFENSTIITPEEMNVFISNGIYDRYINNKKNNIAESEDNIMLSEFEKELKEGLEKQEDSKAVDVDIIISDDEIKLDSEEERFQSYDTEYTVSEESMVFDSGENIEVIDETDSENSIDDDDYVPMSIDEINDVPATTLSISNDRMKEVLDEKYNVTEQDAMKLIDVLTRYKNKENFNVYDELPDIIKNEINKGIMESGGDLRLRNFFAKSFINDIVSETYLDDEIKDFQKEMKEASAPLNNIVGTVMDEYTDELICKFEDHMKDLSEKIKETDPEKSEQLIRVANNFNDTYTLKRVLDNINKNKNCVNRAYKNGRDNWNKINREFKQKYSNVTPPFRELKYIITAMSKLEYPECISKTVACLINDTITESMKIDTVEEHIYSYYILNAFFNLNFTADTSQLLKRFYTSINTVVYEIVRVMRPMVQGKRCKMYPKEFVKFINDFNEFILSVDLNKVNQQENSKLQSGMPLDNKECSISIEDIQYNELQPFSDSNS